MILSSIRGVSSTRLPGEVPLLLPISHPPLHLEDYVNLTHKARNLHQRPDGVNRNFRASGGVPRTEAGYLRVGSGVPVGCRAIGPSAPAELGRVGLPATPAAGETGALTSTYASEIPERPAPRSPAASASPFASTSRSSP